MNKEILEVFKTFQEGYKKRNLDNINEFMNIFSEADDSQMIGIGATEPGEYEWFTGKNEIREIIISDWKFWGNVNLNMDSLRLTAKSNTAWFSICAQIEQIKQKEEALDFFADKMKAFLENKSLSAHDRMFEAAHYGIRRVREENLGAGHMWKAVITGVLVKENTWKFHTLHWSMPVD